MLEEIIRRIAGSPERQLRFDDYLQLTQHDDQLGYYGSGRVAFGARGDYLTAVHISPLFAKALSRALRAVDVAEDGLFLELGAGDGGLAFDLLEDGAIPASRYRIVETSQALRTRQQQHLRPYLPASSWLPDIPADFTGVIFANEVLDSCPFRLIKYHDNRWSERYVASDGDTIHFVDHPCTCAQLLREVAHLDSTVTEYHTEVNTGAVALVGSLAAALSHGVILLLDYGYNHAQYYHPSRSAGTMQCYHRQRKHADPLVAPGEQDITAGVNFSAIATAACDHGCRLVGYCTLANFMIQCGITELLRESHADTRTSGYMQLAAGVQRLTSPGEMGETIKVIAFEKSPADENTAGALGQYLCANAPGDLSWSL